MSMHLWLIFPQTLDTYLWITVLRQDLQHRRFSALNVSHKNQFTSHHQRLCISPFLHDVNDGPIFFFLLFVFAENVKKKKEKEKREKRIRCKQQNSPEIVPVWSRVPVCASRRMLAVDLIEFATAAFYRGEQQPIGAHHSTGFLTSPHCTQRCSQRAKTSYFVKDRTAAL